MHVANSVCFLGTNYATGMKVCCGSTAGLPALAEVLKVMLIYDNLAFVVKLQNTWFVEHLRSYKSSNLQGGVSMDRSCPAHPTDARLDRDLGNL